jgi:ABC-type transporter Mla subunit MlaD
MAKNRSIEIKAGIVVLAGLIILALGMFLVSGGKQQFMEKAYYTILFVDAGGISAGDSVYLDGQKVGEVHETRRIERPDPGANRVSRYIGVTIKINKKTGKGRPIVIPVDSEFIITQTITKIVSMEIASGSSTELAKDETVDLVGSDDTMLQGERQKTFEQTVHKAGLLLDDARAMLKKVDGIIDDVATIVADIDVKRIQDNVNGVLVSVKNSAGKVETILDDAREPIRDTLQNAKGATGEFAGFARELRGDWPGMRGKVHGILDNGVELTGDARDIVRENRETIKSILQKLDDGMDRVGPALAKIETLGNELTGTIVEARPQLSGALRSARKAMENFEALTNDLKTAPWKLVNKPAGDEAAAVRVFGAAQMYVARSWSACAWRWPTSTRTRRSWWGCWSRKRLPWMASKWPSGRPTWSSPSCSSSRDSRSSGSASTS